MTSQHVDPAVIELDESEMLAAFHSGDGAGLNRRTQSPQGPAFNLGVSSWSDSADGGGVPSS